MSDFDFRWLHLSDLHVGMGEQEWLWPTLKHEFFNDMEELLPKTGKWNAVIFSGDLTYQGERDEFDRLSQILGELWAKFKAWGFTPDLFVLPGNHDLGRPSGSQPEVLLLKRWWDESSVREGFFTAKTNRYRSIIEHAFSGYTAWFTRLRESGIPTPQLHAGGLPGDQSAIIKVGDAHIGIVGLNSAWLQLGRGDYKGKLHVDPMQLLAVTGNEPVSWCKANALNIIVTHHPIDWLSGESQGYWNSDINPPGRFDIHLFGHMHEAAASSTSIGGSATRTSLQAASIFGLEHIGDKLGPRTHGYSIAWFQSATNAQQLKVWPRKLRQLSAGHRKLGPDVSFDLGPDNAFIAFRREPGPAVLQSVGETIPAEASLVGVMPASQSSLEVLQKAAYFLTLSKAHLNVRRVDQQRCLAALSDRRAVWLIADWGMGEDGFVSSIQAARNQNGRPTYRLDLSEYKDRESFFSAVKQKFQCSFERFCELISNEGPAYLLLDDIPSGVSVMEGARTVEHDVEDLVDAILEYCPELNVFLRAHRVPQQPNVDVVELKPLDEADLKTYVVDHDRGGSRYESPNAVACLYRHTEGVPAHVERSLSELEVVTLDELASSSSDFVATKTALSEAPPPLSRTIRELASATEPTLRRSFELLRVLTVFPEGEQLSRIKRFDGTHPFFPMHATALLDQRLIEVSSTHHVDVGGHAEPTKTLHVPRIIRECVRANIDDSDLQRLNMRAANLYFGDNWSNGTLKLRSAYRFDKATCSNADIANASTIILRLFRDAEASGAQKAIQARLRLATAYVSELVDGNHFRSGAIFCEDILTLIPESRFEDEKARLKVEFVRCLRMSGSNEKTKAIALEISNHSLPKYTRQNLLINLALCHEHLGEDKEAVATAEEIVKIDSQSLTALHAEAIILDLNKNDPERVQKLLDHEALCRKRGATVVANNIAIDLADEAEDRPEDAGRYLKGVLYNGKGSDFYNETRAVIRLAEHEARRGNAFSDADLARLIGAYHFVFNERFSGLLNQCHDVLWKAFERKRETGNLLSLFRHSSFFWRLRGREDREKRYLQRLTKMVGSAISRDPRIVDREAAYYLVRANTLMLPAQKSPSVDGR